ncbi:GNAT family N-acetyltransferase [Amycolatopsis jiangsuensis]|uniref:RimJ/RimL family protein N-acetyltransferase n=1 Tax=Amycolatopsis jiangsuensis TaxID=1181879 RepID=A0A840IYT6_9PSEU|nr:GNAT family N-acetyltransferase [Amycolatopsis jiangsuensis]MBB4686990.1 RimJ/RimL family protein N-acetyltransferase [Amycolatopsis jiangsuensis]
MTPPAVTARDATEADAELLLSWRNDPRTREASRSTGVIALADHQRWLHGVLADRDRMLLVVEQDAAPVGTVRFDHEGAGEWEVSITLAPRSRGRGLSRIVLAEGERILAQRRGAVAVLAAVHPDNAASGALFERSGYREGAPAGNGFRRLRKTLG